jgi:hypothetical protein
MLSARDLKESPDIARELGDVGSTARCSMNLLRVFYLGEPGTQPHYECRAAARRAGRSSTRLYARANLAHLYIYFGSYERARSESTRCSTARAAGQRSTIAQLTALSGELSARTGNLEQALISYDDALSRYAALGRTREVIEHNLDAADALLTAPARPTHRPPAICRERANNSLVSRWTSCGCAWTWPWHEPASRVASRRGCARPGDRGACVRCVVATSSGLRRKSGAGARALRLGVCRQARAPPP